MPRIIRNILYIAIPAVVTNVTTPLLSLCDVAVVGHMGSAVYIAAIAVGGSMFNMLYWLCGFLRMGSSGITAQAYGAGDMPGTHAIVWRGLILALLTGSLFVLLRYPICDGLMLLIDATGETRTLAMGYFSICIWGAPAVLASFVLSGYFLGLQDSRLPMWMSVLINVVNIGVSLTLVYVFRMKIEGVAFGTLTAQITGCVFAVVTGAIKYGVPEFDFRRICNFKEISKFLKVNRDIFLRTVCLVGVTLWFTRIGASQGTVMLAVNTLLMQMFTIFSYMMDGLGFAGEALCGRYCGAHDDVMLRRTVRGLMTMGLIASLVFTAIYFIEGDGLLGILSSDKVIAGKCQEYFGWAVSIPLLSFMAFVWDGVMIGLTRTGSMLLSMALGAGAFFLLYMVLFPVLGNHGLWIAFLSYLFVRGVTLQIVGRRYLWYSSR